MIADLSLRPLVLSDAPVIAAAFIELGWPGKTRSKYEGYVQQQNAGERDTIVAALGDQFAGYICVTWTSPYPPFRDAGIPEIQDFNVLPAYRRRGIGGALMDAAEQLAASRSAIVGLGVGLYADYGSAQRMYAKRGYVPDGRGIMYDGEPVPPGESVRIDDDACLYFTVAVN